MMQYNFIAEIKCKKNSKTAVFCNTTDEDFEDLAADRAMEQEKDCDYNYLGVIAYLFLPAEIANDVYEKPYRAFHDGIADIQDGMRIYYRSGGGDEEFFKALFDACEDIKSITITVDDEDESTVEDFGKNFTIKFKR